MDAVKNFAIVTVNQGYDASATSIVLTAGHGAKLPAPATDGEFNLIWYNATDYSNPSDDPNVEIVRVTARSTDTLTVTRAQESTSATVKNTGGKTYKMVLGMTAKMIEDIGVPEVSKEGLVLAMNFNSESIDGSAGSEKVLDSSGHNNHGTNSGATHDDDGGFNDGGAFDFDGENDLLTIPDDASLNPTKAVSWSVWIKLTSFPAADSCIMDKAGTNKSRIQIGNNGAIKVNDFGGQANDMNSNAGEIELSHWYHIVVTYDPDAGGNNAKIYKNGVKVKDLAWTGDNVFGGICYIGRYHTVSNLVDGLIDEPRIYTRALSADEIRNLYMAKKEIHNSFVSQKDIYVDSAGKPAIQNDILNIKTAKTPATAGATGVAGDICWDANYIYVCTATNTWKRVAIATW